MPVDTADETAGVTLPVLAVGVVAVGFGVASAWNFLYELSSLSVAVPPLVVFCLGMAGTVSLGYGTVRLHRGDLPPSSAWTVALWVYAGLLVLVVVTAISILVRLAEGRPVGEPQLELILNGEAGALAGLVSGYYYATAQRRADEAERAEEAMEFLNSTLRHELLNDVSVVNGFAQDPPDDVGAARDRLAVIEDQSAEMEATIRDIRDVARAIEGGDGFEPIDVGSLLHEEVESVGATYPDAEVTLDVPPDLYVRANPALSHVFGNIIENAVEHNDAAVPRVDVAATVEDGDVVVTVADNGPGIDAERERAVFGRDTGDDHGFGLYFVETLVDRFGGDVSVTDSECGGARFDIALEGTSADRSGETDGTPVL